MRDSILDREGKFVLGGRWQIDRESAPGFRVITLQDETYIFFWQHLLYAHGNSDRVVVSLLTHTITFEGKNLGGLLSALRTYSLETIEQTDRTVEFEIELDDKKPVGDKKTTPIAWEISIKPVKNGK